MIFMLTSERERPAMSPHLCARNVKPTARGVFEGDIVLWQSGTDLDCP